MDRRHRPGASIVEAQLFWERELQAVRHVELGDELRLEGLNVELPTDLDLVVARRDGEGRPYFVLPDGIVVPEGSRMSLRIGRLTLRLAFVVDDAPALPRAPFDPRIRFGVLAGLAAHVVFFSFFAFSPPKAVDPPHAPVASIRRTFVTPQSLGLGDLSAPDEAPVASTSSPPRESESSQVSAAHAPSPKVEASAANFGMLALLPRKRTRSPSPFARDTKPSRAIFDGAPELASVGGLDLSGVGEAGGGKGAGVPLDFGY